MAKKRIRRKRKKSNSKIQESSSYASLCALSALIDSRGIFECIHENVEIPQKEVDYRPTDKLVFVVLGIGEHFKPGASLCVTRNHEIATPSHLVSDPHSR